MSLITKIFIFVFLLPTLSWAKSASSATLAEVAGKVVTTRDVQISSVMNHWFSLHDQPSAPKAASKAKGLKPIDYRSWFLDPKSEAFRHELSAVMVEQLVVVEAENFSVAKLSKAEIDTVVHSLGEELKASSEWQALEISPAELEEHVSRHLRAKEFMKFKAESMGLQVSDETARAYYEKNRIRFNNLPFENFKSSIKEYLTSQDVESKMKDWFDVLRKKYKVKILQFDSSANG
jgi:hypothetical protein